jgi:hypothetical protein
MRDFAGPRRTSRARHREHPLGETPFEIVQQAMFSIDPAPIELALPFALRAGEKDSVVFDDLLAAAVQQSRTPLMMPPPCSTKSTDPSEAETPPGRSR